MRRVLVGTLGLLPILSACGTGHEQSQTGSLDQLQTCESSDFVAAFTSASTEDPSVNLTTPDGISRVYGLRSDGSVQLLTEEPASYRFAFGSDASKLLAVPSGSPDNVMEYDENGVSIAPSSNSILVVSTTGETESTIRNFRNVAAVALSPDGQTGSALIYEGSAASVVMFDVASGEEGPRYAVPGLGTVVSLEWRPDGKTISVLGLFNSAQARILEFDLTSGEVMSYDLPFSSVNSLDWSADSMAMLVGAVRPNDETSDFVALVVNRDDGQSRTISLGSDIVSSLQFDTQGTGSFLGLGLGSTDSGILQRYEIDEVGASLVAKIELPNNLENSSGLSVPQCARGAA